MKRIFITGASTGIGAALAREYATGGNVLGLAARGFEKLNSLKASLSARGCTIHLFEVDVTDVKQCQNAARDFLKKAGGVDLVIANAGISRKFKAMVPGAEELNEILKTNTLGVVNTIAPFLGSMIENKAGQVVIISSVASFRALPGSSYSASKIAASYLAEMYRFQLKQYGIAVSTIYPGFVKTPLTDKNEFNMPFIMPAEKAAALIANAVEKKKANYIFPWQWRFMKPVIRFMPRFIFNSLMVSRQEKKGKR